MSREKSILSEYLSLIDQGYLIETIGILSDYHNAAQLAIQVKKKFLTTNSLDKVDEKILTIPLLSLRFKEASLMLRSFEIENYHLNPERIKFVTKLIKSYDNLDHFCQKLALFIGYEKEISRPVSLKMVFTTALYLSWENGNQKGVDEILLFFKKHRPKQQDYQKLGDNFFGVFTSIIADPEIKIGIMRMLSSVAKHYPMKDRGTKLDGSVEKFITSLKAIEEAKQDTTKPQKKKRKHPSKAERKRRRRAREDNAAQTIQKIARGWMVRKEENIVEKEDTEQGAMTDAEISEAFENIENAITSLDTEKQNYWQKRLIKLRAKIAEERGL